MKRSTSLIIRICYLLLWMLILILALLPNKDGVLQSEVTDREGAAMLYAILLVMSLPISAILVAVLWGIGRVLMLSQAGQDLVHAIEAVLSNDPKWFTIEFPVCWLLLLSISYWQWFWLAPKIVAALRRKSADHRMS